MKTSIGIALVGMLMAGCASVSPVPSRLAREYRTRVGLFVITLPDGSEALALDDSHFYSFKLYSGAPSLEEWAAHPDKYPEVKGYIPAGTVIRPIQVRRELGFSIGYGFGSRTDVVGEISGGTLGPIVINDLLLPDEAGKRNIPNLKYIEIK
jgi:hypothetical protein